MILQALCAYARDAELVEDPAFETRPVDYKLEIDENGHFIGMTPFINKRELTPRKRVDKTALGKADFLVDKASYILAQRQYFSGKAQKGKTREDDQEKKACKNLSAYRNYLRQVVDPVSTPLAALLAFLDSPEERAAADRALASLEKESVEGTAEKAPERGAKILVPAINGEFLHKNSAVKEAWKAYFERDGQAGRNDGAQAVCLVTGEKAPIERIHPNIIGIPGSHSAGAKLISFDKDAFQSHGQIQGNNAPISKNAAQLYTAALNDLISKRKEGGRKSAVQLDDQTIVAFWTREPDELTRILGEAVDEFWEEKEKETASLRDRLEAFWKGRASKAGQPNAFYALTLSANRSRVVIRDWFETTSVDAADNMNQWFKDVSLSSQEGFFPLKKLLQSLEASSLDKEKQKDKKKKQEDNDQTKDKDKDKLGLPSSLMGQIFRAILLGMPLPSALLAKAVQRMRVPSQSMLKYRAALIKAALIRHPSLHLQRKDLTVSLNPENHEPAYLLGRLFAVLDKLQYEAHRDNTKDQKSVNSTIRDRYYGAASATPAAVFGQLLRLSMNHASKLLKDPDPKRRSTGGWLEKIKSEIMNALEAKPMPKTLKLEEQGLFALGYYQQRAKFFEKKEKDESIDASDSDAA